MGIKNNTTELNSVDNLRKKETYLRTIFNSIKDAIFIHDAESGAIIDINQRGRLMYGLAEQSLEHIDAELLCSGKPPYTPNEAFKWIQKARTEGPQLIEWHARHLNGSIFPVEVALCTEWINGEERVIAVVRDISERKTTESALNQSEQSYQTLFENLTAGFALHEMIYDEEGDPQDYRYISVNPAFEKLTGLSAEKVVGRTVREVLPNIEDYWIETYGRVAQTGIPSNFDNYVNSLDRYFETRAFSPKKDQFAVLFSDITQRKQLQDALEKRVVALTRPIEGDCGTTFQDLFNLDEIQQLQDEFANATGVASIITTPEGIPITKPSNFTCFCRDVIRTTEIGCANCYKSDAVLGRFNPDGPIVQPCLSGGLWDAGASIRAGGKHIASWLIGQVRDETQSEESMLVYAKKIGADQQPFLEAFRKVPIMSQKQFKHVARSLYTLANQLSKTAYQNIQQARFIAEEARRTDELRQLQKMEAVGQLAGGISHDFNNILQVIIGFSQILENSLDSGSDDHECVQEIHKAANRAAALTRQMLTFSRNQPVQHGKLDLNHTIIEAEALLNMVLREKHNIVFQLEPALQSIYADADQITQIIMNMAVNARDAMPAGGTFTLSTENITLSQKEAMLLPSAHPGYFVCLTLADTGFGMSDTVKHHLFEPFFTTKSVGKGTGLGLSVVYGIVKQYQGWVNTFSEPEKGTTFKIYLPVAESINE